MNKHHEPTVALTGPGDLNAIPWDDLDGKREFSLLLGMTIGDDDLSFQDSVFLDPFADELCTV